MVQTPYPIPVATQFSWRPPSAKPTDADVETAMTDSVPGQVSSLPLPTTPGSPPLRAGEGVGEYTDTPGPVPNLPELAMEDTSQCPSLAATPINAASGVEPGTDQQLAIPQDLSIDMDPVVPPSALPTPAPTPPFFPPVAQDSEAPSPQTEGEAAQANTTATPTYEPPKHPTEDLTQPTPLVEASETIGSPAQPEDEPEETMEGLLTSTRLDPAPLLASKTTEGLADSAPLQSKSPRPLEKVMAKTQPRSRRNAGRIIVTEDHDSQSRVEEPATGPTKEATERRAVKVPSKRARPESSSDEELYGFSWETSMSEATKRDLMRKRSESCGFLAATVWRTFLTASSARN
jgi:hypothetical protein